MGLFSSQISAKETVPVCRQLATAYDAGIPIIRGLELTAEQAPKGRPREVLLQMALDLRQGATLEQAARAQQKYLPPYFVALLASGERGGRLDVMLRDLAEYYEDRLAMRRKVVAMLFYPCTLLVLTWFIGTFAFRLINGVLALISDPRSTGRFDFDAFLRSYGLFQLKALAVVVLVVAVCAGLARLGLFKWIWSGFTTHVWPVSIITRKLALARFFRSMSLLIEAGLPITECIQSSARITGNPYIERDLMKAVPRVKEGETLHSAFSACNSLTGSAREMILVGEESGRVDALMRKVSDYFMDETQHAIKKATVLLGTGIVVAVAFLVGYLIISFYVTLYGGMMDAIGI